MIPTDDRVPTRPPLHATILHVPRTLASLVSSLLLLTACKFPVPPDVNDDGRSDVTDGGIDAPALAPMIAFTSDRAGNLDIFTMRIDGTDVVNLTNNPADEQGPTWSPDGAHLAFTSNRSGTSEIYVMDPSGRSVVNVSMGRGDGPAWAPDSASLLFTSNRNGTTQIFRTTVGGAAPTLVTAQTASSPAHSPDGSEIVFAGVDGLFVMNANGTSPRRITSGTDASPQWRPDGTAIVFTRRVTFNNHDIHVIARDGTPIRESPGPVGAVLDPRWSPDGARIAVWGGIDVDPEIYVFNTITGSIVDVSNLASIDTQPVWAPDGTRIAFQSSGEIRLVHPGGGQLTNITNVPSQDFDPSWRP